MSKQECCGLIAAELLVQGSQAASSEEVDSASNKAERSGRKRRKKQDNSANGQPSASKAEAKLSKEAASLSKANGLFHAKLAAEHSEEKKLPSKKKVRGKSAAKAAGVGKDAKSTESSNTAAEGSEATKVPSAEATYRKFRKEVFKKQEQSLNESQGEGALREGVLQDALESFKKDSKVRDKALAVYVSSEVLVSCCKCYYPAFRHLVAIWILFFALRFKNPWNLVSQKVTAALASLHVSVLSMIS